jgi:hypothetical protein
MTHLQRLEGVPVKRCEALLARLRVPRLVPAAGEPVKADGACDRLCGGVCAGGSVASGQAASLNSRPTTSSILFYSILFYSILFYSTLFYSICVVGCARGGGVPAAGEPARCTVRLQKILLPELFQKEKN